ncbi:MAG TPA: helix-hairpin-helix domain-containing protein [Phenylobacterium sp.]|nr:helix-hairpin-helix domain-containing protein [Phenylobacterium sp.]
MSRLTRESRLVLIVSIGLLLASAGWANARPHAPRRSADPDTAAFRKVCGRCHNIEVPRDTVQSAADWRDTVQLMVDRGAKGTDAQFAGVMRYLRAHLTTVNVNHASAAELSGVLDVPAAVAEAIVARRERQPFHDLADLETVPGIDPSALEARKGRIFF